MLAPCTKASTSAAVPCQPRADEVTSAVNVVAAYAATTASTTSSNAARIPATSHGRGTPVIGTGYGSSARLPPGRPAEEVRCGTAGRSRQGVQAVPGYPADIVCPGAAGRGSI